MRSNSFRETLLGFLLFGLLASAATACSVPVFRYALERWPPDNYHATVFHRGGLTNEDFKVISLLASSHANLEVELVDIDQAGETETARWKEQETDTLPWLYVTYPEAHPVGVELAAGMLEKSLAEAILGPPFRKSVAQQLVDGETAVWILLESGDKAKDEAAWTMLEKHLDELESTLELPTIEQEDIDSGLLSVDEDSLKIAFSAIRLSQTKPADEMLVRMLLDTEEDLIDRDEPMVFPVFGRGRVLYALVGEGITAETLKLAASYLTGACSCQVKSENPGIDLLISMNWDEVVESSLETDRELPPLAGILPEPPVSEEVVIAPDAPSPPLGEAMETTSANGRMLWTTLGALVLMLIVVAIASAFYTSKKV